MVAHTSTREPAVAGAFYPGEEAELQSTVVRLLEQATPGVGIPRPKALIVPHAGYVYSGSTAAQAYAQLRAFADDIKTVVLLGPAHRVYLEGIALPTHTTFNTPLGGVPTNREAMAKVMNVPGVITSDEAHRQEHSIEVQLPFLQQVLAEFSLVPLVVGSCSPTNVGAVIDTLLGGPETLFVISSDLSHFENYESARRHDSTSCKRILAGESTLVGTDACGAAPINGFLASQRGSALQRQLLAYCNSGDTAGDKQRVVGYASFSLH